MQRLQQFEQVAGCRSGGSWILSGDQVSVYLHKGRPIRSLRVETAKTFQFVFHEEWNHLGKLRGLLLCVRETGYVLSLYQWGAVGCYDVLQHSRSMAHESDGFSRTVHRLNQRD